MLSLATILAALPIVALAAPTSHGEPHHVHSEVHHSEVHQVFAQCNVGTLSCCNQVQSVSGATTANAGGLVGVPVNLMPLIGLDCNPISAAIGIGGNNCAAQPVCCTNNNMPGLINALNCSPVNVNL